MEVVLSPGRFGDEVPGAPFQNEEIREWSHVDRLTGMLERARVETGRWKSLNQGAARSYGKVIDSRERNSADGSIVQRARRQVEVFQSEAPGRSVQVVRASQWSSSRVTDSTTPAPSLSAITSLAQKKNGAATSDRSVDRSWKVNKLSPSLSLSRDEAISSRLSTLLLGSFAHRSNTPPSLSTVPLRRIDSKYATRMPISLPTSKRSTSNEDLVGGHSQVNNGRPALFADNKSLRNSHNPSYQEIKEKSKVPRQIQDCPKNSDQDARHKVHEITVERDYQESRLEESRDSATSDNSQDVITVDQARPTTNKAAAAAIQLLPFGKANTTVVNLINDSDNSQADPMDISQGKRANILSWVLPTTTTSIVGDESTIIDTEEKATPSTMEATTSASPRRESRIEESVMNPFSPGRSVKRVGFCKTEIHFAADSGKVNIVETDEKPPPTNKFRRRRRNSLTGVSSGKNLPIEKLPILADTKDDPLEQRIAGTEDIKTKSDSDLQRAGHTTSINLGSDLSAKNQRTNKENAVPSEATVKAIEKENNCLGHSAALTSIESEHVARQDICNVVCTDADNNQVLLKVVTTHEPTIARVENDHIGNNMKTKLPVSIKKERRSNKCPASSTKKLQSHKEHTYVNVFTGSKRAPIYENYKVIDPNSIIVTDNNIEASLTLDTNSVIEKNDRVPDTKTQAASQPSRCSAQKSKDTDDTTLESVKLDDPVAPVDGKLSKDTEFNKTLVGNKKARTKTKESKLTRTEGTACNITNHSTSSSRGKSGKQMAKNPTSRSSVSSGERDQLLLVSGNNIHAPGKNSIASKSTRDATSAKRMNKCDVLTKHKPIEVVYQTAVYNMKNEKLKKPQKGKESKGPRYLNELICGAKMKRISDSKSGKTSGVAQDSAKNKSTQQPMKHWK